VCCGCVAGVLQVCCRCVAVCCSVMQVCCSVLRVLRVLQVCCRCVAVCSGCVTECCSVLQVCDGVLQMYCRRVADKDMDMCIINTHTSS